MHLLCDLNLEHDHYTGPGLELQFLSRILGYLKILADKGATPEKLNEFLSKTIGSRSLIDAIIHPDNNTEANNSDLFYLIETGLLSNDTLLKLKIKRDVFLRFVSLTTLSDERLFQLALDSQNPDKGLGRYFLLATYGSAEPRVCAEPFSPEHGVFLRKNARKFYEMLRDNRLSDRQLPGLAFLRKEIIRLPLSASEKIQMYIVPIPAQSALRKFLNIQVQVDVRDLECARMSPPIVVDLFGYLFEWFFPTPPGSVERAAVIKYLERFGQNEFLDYIRISDSEAELDVLATLLPGLKNKLLSFILAVEDDGRFIDLVAEVLCAESRLGYYMHKSTPVISPGLKNKCVAKMEQIFGYINNPENTATSLKLVEVFAVEIAKYLSAKADDEFWSHYVQAMDVTTGIGKCLFINNGALVTPASPVMGELNEALVKKPALLLAKLLSGDIPQKYYEAFTGLGGQAKLVKHISELASHESRNLLDRILTREDNPLYKFMHLHPASVEALGKIRHPDPVVKTLVATDDAFLDVPLDEVGSPPPPKSAVAPLSGLLRSFGLLRSSTSVPVASGAAVPEDIQKLGYRL